MDLQELSEEVGVTMGTLKTYFRKHGVPYARTGRLDGATIDVARAAFGRRAPRREVGQVVAVESGPAPLHAAPPAPVPAPAQLEVEGHYRKQVEGVLVARDEAIAERDAARAEVASLQDRLSRARATQAPPPRAPPAALDLRTALATAGFGADPAAAFAALLRDPAAAPRALAATSVRGPEAFTTLLAERLRTVCHHADCRALAAASHWVVVDGTPAACAVCHGSDNDRAYARLSRAWREAGLGKLIVVGGAEDSFAELRRHNETHKHPDLRLVEGGHRPDKRQARDLCRGADLVVLWGSTQVHHAETEVWSSAAHAQDTPALTMGNGQRGVKALAEAVLDWVARR